MVSTSLSIFTLDVSAPIAQSIVTCDQFAVAVQRPEAKHTSRALPQLGGAGVDVKVGVNWP